MPKIIEDEFSNRTDLSRCKKWKLRHPEQYRISHAAQMRVFRVKNPDSCDATRAKYNRKKKLKSLSNSKAYLERSILKVTNVIGNRLRKEILMLNSKGKDVGQIAVWTNVPVSIVRSVIEKVTL